MTKIIEDEYNNIGLRYKYMRFLACFFLGMLLDAER
jgi:hypothetical protein